MSAPSFSRQQTFTLRTDQRERLYDITEPVARLVADSKVQNGLVSVYAQGARPRS